MLQVLVRLYETCREKVRIVEPDSLAQALVDDRKGAQGGSSELLSIQQQREMGAYYMGELRRLGSDLPYEEFADITPGVESAEGVSAR
jgi:hypothetical protein